MHTCKSWNVDLVSQQWCVESSQPLSSSIRMHEARNESNLGTRRSTYTYQFTKLQCLAGMTEDSYVGARTWIALDSPEVTLVHVNDHIEWVLVPLHKSAHRKPHLTVVFNGGTRLEVWDCTRTEK